ncbi:MAG: phosphoglucomutase/phosphomannomutase family protein [Saprospiraceae bacterium]|jgi:phosphomannomutase|nr:phosphoglucomutase/phosphomannomutase family protein [Saprospiraceae bacterium]MBK6816548.1 phosphoglucomutase/phosphomannomutase family protein [Saprospiraceae bacterium]MBK7436426.1 phosphoglucomutase/phosphomannomutase family protein [Saprospiraceae bacterium]MBK8514554.1 phosphoglucomutase/phosphomannomutase family protein [Saprospiraceae bacterium]MBP7803308.1 phosphoglucomutase/phosphomannomutase family protein [Saprospiraceae bacterium]
MLKIKFGTDGWRAIIADDYTIDNVRRVAKGTSTWMKQKNMSKAIIGYDTRFGGSLFAKAVADLLAGDGHHVYLSNDYASTPMVSLGVLHLQADLGIVITASHNPPSYNGYKLKASYGGPMIPSEVTEIENLIPDSIPTNMDGNGKIELVDLEKIYEDKVRAAFDIPTIQAVAMPFAYDAMYGAGQRIMKKLFPEAIHLHSDFNPSFHGQAPEPIERNLSQLIETVKSDPAIKVGAATDGDADRIGMLDQYGEFVDSHHLLLLLLYYQHHFKKQKGKVLITFSVTDKVKKLADLFGVECEVTKIGFKYISEIMMHTPILVAGEESGGIAVAGHIPERDGVWIALTILEFMASTGKSLTDLINEVYAMVGAFKCDRDDLHLDESKKQTIIQACKDRAFTSFGSYKIESVEDMDGYKFLFGFDEWVMVRPSGTEPVLRVYAQAGDSIKVRKLLDAAKEALLSVQ